MKGKDSDRDLSSAGLFPKFPQQIVMGWDEATIGSKTLCTLIWDMGIQAMAYLLCQTSNPLLQVLKPGVSQKMIGSSEKLV